MHYTEAKTILTPQNGLNIYRGCTNNCIYCDARSKCHRIKHEFTDVCIKESTEYMLNQALKKKRTKGMILMGNLADPYMDIESELRLVRASLMTIERNDFGVSLDTKSSLILRDLELLSDINKKTKAVVGIYMGIADDEILEKIEPGCASFSERCEIALRLSEKGIPVIFKIDPIIPYLNDTNENLMKILNVAKEAGIYGVECNDFALGIRDGSREHFFNNIGKVFPELKTRLQDLYDTKLELVSPNKDVLMETLKKFCDENNIIRVPEEITRFRRVYENKTVGTQMSIFDILN